MSREQMTKAVPIGAGASMRARLEPPAAPVTAQGPVIMALEELRRVVGRLEECIPALSDRVSAVSSRADDPVDKKIAPAVAGGSSPLMVELLALAERVDMAADGVLRVVSRVEL